MQAQLVDPYSVSCPISRCGAKRRTADRQHVDVACRSRDGEPHAERVERAESRARLLELLPKGTTVWVVCRAVSASGLRRYLDLYTFAPHEEYGVTKIYLTYHVANLLGYSLSPRSNSVKGDCLIAEGCGMDMGFHVVHSLSYALHGHDNHDGEGFERSGYTLRQEWI